MLINFIGKRGDGLVRAREGRGGNHSERIGPYACKCFINDTRDAPGSFHTVLPTP
jgi:hypothetical protein